MPNESEKALKQYLFELESRYDSLIGVLRLEAEDITAQDEQQLIYHSEIERQIIQNIKSITKTVVTYTENTVSESHDQQVLIRIDDKKAEAQALIIKNINDAQKTMNQIKDKINRIKLPKSARRVYYSGNNPGIMDIEI